MHPRLQIALAAAVLTTTAPLARSGPRPASAASPPAASATASAVRTAIVPWKSRPWSPTSALIQGSGLWISRDPVDGTLGMPDPATVARLAVGANANTDTPVSIERLADGTLIALLDDRWANYAVATLGPGGKPAWQCVPGLQGAAQFMARPEILVAPTPVKWEDK